MIGTSPERGATLELTPEGRRSWILRPGTTDHELVRAWSELPPILGFNRFGPSKAASMILARTTGGEPLLIALETGKGRVLVIAGPTWNWARASDGSRSTHRDFWRRALHWAAHREMPCE